MSPAGRTPVRPHEPAPASDEAAEPARAGPEVAPSAGPELRARLAAWSQVGATDPDPAPAEARAAGASPRLGDGRRRLILEQAYTWLTLGLLLWLAWILVHWLDPAG